MAYKSGFDTDDDLGTWKQTLADFGVGDPWDMEQDVDHTLSIVQRNIGT